VNFAIAGRGSKRLNVQFRITRNDCHSDAVPITLCEQCLEELARWQADLGSKRFSGKILGIQITFAQFVTDSHLIQKPSRVGLLRHSTPMLGTIRSGKTAPSQRFNSLERRTHRTSEDWTHSSLLPVP
jgi:hypothetical protein